MVSSAVGKFDNVPHVGRVGGKSAQRGDWSQAPLKRQRRLSGPRDNMSA